MPPYKKSGPRLSTKDRPIIKNIASATITRPAVTGPRREFLLKRLRAADGPEYGDLVAEVVDAFPERTAYWTRVRGARSVRDLLWDQMATVDTDGGVWLLPSGWQAGA